jgi:leucyl-tRNA synthetase
VGTRRFIEKVWRLHEKVDKESSVQDDITKSIHKAIKKVSDDIEAMAFNTAVSTLMITVNEMEKVPSVSREQYGTLLKLLAPFAPHVAEELWSKLGNRQSIHLEAWPEFDPKLVIDTEATIVLQIGGKTRGSFKAPANTAKEDLENAARNLPEAVRWLAGRKVIKVVVVPGRLVNFVISEGS